MRTKTKIGRPLAVISDCRFLLLKLQTDYLLESWDPLELKKRLKSLPTALTGAYSQVIRDRMTPGHLSFACRILSWIIHAQRILTMSELLEALAIQIGEPSLDKGDIPKADRILLACCGLVNHAPDTDLVTLSHETVRSFLNSDEFRSLLEERKVRSLLSHSELSKICLTFLQLPVFEKQSDNIAKLSREWLAEFKFGKYAALFWAVHARLSEREVELESEILKTFSSATRRNVMEALRSHHHNTQEMSLFHVLIQNGLTFLFISPNVGSIEREWVSLSQSS